MSTPGPHIGEQDLLDLVLGATPRGASAEALRHARHCADCERRFLDLVRERELARMRPAPAFRNGRIELADPRATPGPRPAGSRRRWLVLAAASAVLVAVTGTALLVGVRPVAVAPYRPPIIAAPLEHREAGSDLRTSFEQDVFDAYRRGDDERVVELFRADPFAGSRPDLLLLLAGAQAARGAAAAAAETLERLEVPTLPLPWRDHARRLQYDVFRAVGRDPQAFQALVPLAESNVPGMREFARAEAAGRRIQLPTRMNPPQ